MVSSSALYGGTVNQFKHVLRKMNVELTGVDPDDPSAWRPEQLSDYIVSTHHAYVRSSIPLIASHLEKLIAAIKSEIGDLDKVSRVVKVVGFVASDPGFTGHPGVINGASELLVKAFGDKGVHARSAVGVAALPLDAPVEVEVVVSVAD